MELYLIRHGECYGSDRIYYDEDKRTMDPPLTNRGIQQAKELGQRIAEMAMDRIYCSDLKRAIKTAEIINEYQKKELVITKALREIDYGELYKKSWNDYPEVFSQWKTHKEDTPYPGGENGQDVWKRCKPLIDSIIEREDKRIAIVCHGGTIRSMLSGLLELPQHKRFLFGCPLKNCSVSIVKYVDGQFCLHSLNQ